MVENRRCCIFAFSKNVKYGCCCPIDGQYPTTLIKNGSKDNDLLRKQRPQPYNNARGVNYQTVNVNDSFWEKWSRRKGCSLQVYLFRLFFKSIVFDDVAILSYLFCSRYLH